MNDYMNARYQTRRAPAASLGRKIIPFLPPLRAAVDAKCRHLPPPHPNLNRLLDIGSGSGEFVQLANEMGWDASGIDFDEKAVLVARDLGLNVRHASFEDLATESRQYDAITLGHVIEHVHDPALLLSLIFKLLRPGGVLWLETPNARSIGAWVYGADWRGLEPPRHLLVFNKSSIESLLHQAGFVGIQQRWRGLVTSAVFLESQRIREKFRRERSPSGWTTRIGAYLSEIFELFLPVSREFLTYTAIKPK